MTDPKADTALAERHASWLELFFDLVVVAAVFQLAHRVHGDPSLADIGVFAGLYLAVWLSWTSFTLYANVAGDRTRHRSMLVAMLGIAVMAAAVPAATGARAVPFAIAYVVVRLLALRTWARTGTALLAWPSVQASTGIVPWIVSIWTPGPTRYVLWGVGMAIDLLLPLVTSDRPEDVLDQMRARLERRERRRRRHRAGHHVDPGRARPVDLDEARLDLPHLAERLGLFVIIVMGEAVLGITTVAASEEWTADLGIVALAGFALLVALWWPVFRYGFIGERGQGMPPQLVLPLHFLTVASITAIAAGLGSLAAHPQGSAATGVRWLLCGGLAVYFLNILVGGLAARVSAGWLALGAPPCMLACALLGFLGDRLPGAVLAWLLVLVVVWQDGYAWLWRRSGSAAAAG